MVRVPVETNAFDYRRRHRTKRDQRLVVPAEMRRRFPKQIIDTSLTREIAFRVERDGLPNNRGFER